MTKKMNFKTQGKSIKKTDRNFNKLLENYSEELSHTKQQPGFFSFSTFLVNAKKVFNLIPYKYLAKLHILMISAVFFDIVFKSFHPTEFFCEKFMLSPWSKDF